MVSVFRKEVCNQLLHAANPLVEPFSIQNTSVRFTARSVVTTTTTTQDQFSLGESHYYHSHTTLLSPPCFNLQDSQSVMFHELCLSKSSWQSAPRCYSNLQSFVYRMASWHLQIGKQFRRGLQSVVSGCTAMQEYYDMQAFEHIIYVYITYQRPQFQQVTSFHHVVDVVAFPFTRRGIGELVVLSVLCTV